MLYTCMCKSISVSLHVWVTDSCDYWMVLRVTWVFEGLLHPPNSLRMLLEVQMIGAHKYIHIPT